MRLGAHLSPESGHVALLELIDQQPSLNLEMRLGEATGAALAMNIIGAAVAVFTEMATFTSASVSDKDDDKQLEKGYTAESKPAEANAL